MRWISRFVLALLFVSLPTTFLQSSSPTLDTSILLTGRVISSATGGPLADVTVFFIDRNFPLDRWDAARTDSAGYYTVTQTLFYSWMIEFAPPDEGHLGEYYENISFLESGLDPKVFTFEVGMEETGIDAALTATGEAQISGRVTAAATGDPLQDVVVDVYDADGKLLTYNDATDSRGVYTVTALAGDAYRLRFRPGESNPFAATEYYNNQATLATAEVITVASAEVRTGVDVALEAAGMITGFVTAQGTTLYGAVAAYDADGQVVKRNSGFASPDRVYTLPNLPPGDYRLLLQDFDQQYRPEYYDDQPTLEEAQPVTVEAGQVTANINAELVPTPTHKVSAIATSSALPDTIVLAFEYDPAPRFTTDGGLEWHEVDATPWVPDSSANIFFAVSLGLVPREGFSGQRILYDNQNKIYRSGDLGHSWAEQGPVTECTALPSFDDLVASPINAEQLYVIEICIYDYYRTARLLRSDDGGITWQTVNTPVEFLEQVVLSPILPDRFYIQEGDTWYVTSDGGAQWAEMPWEDTDSFLKELVPDGEDANLLYGWHTPYGPPYLRVGMRSEDGGDTWTEWDVQPCLNLYDVQLLAHPTVSRVLFARCEAGIFRSENGGDAWQQIATTPGQLLTFDAGVPGRLLWAKDDGLWASTDQGETWQNIMPDFVALPAQSLIPMYLPNIVASEVGTEE